MKYEKAIKNIFLILSVLNVLEILAICIYAQINNFWSNQNAKIPLVLCVLPAGLILSCCSLAFVAIKKISDIINR